MLCTKIGFCFGIQNNFYSQHVLNLYFSRTELVIPGLNNSMNNMLSYFGLIDARMSAPEKEQTVQKIGPIYFNKF